MLPTIQNFNIRVKVLTISRNFHHLTYFCEVFCCLFIWNLPSEREINSSTPAKSPRKVWRLRCCGEYTSWFTRPQGCSIFSPVSRLSCTSSLSLSPCPFNFPQTLFFPPSHTSCLRLASSSVYFLCVHKIILPFVLTYAYTTVLNILWMKVNNHFCCFIKRNYNINSQCYRKTNNMWNRLHKWRDYQVVLKRSSPDLVTSPAV
jgi:hypothetical protein